jgi:hypothetical protein
VIRGFLQSDFAFPDDATAGILLAVNTAVNMLKSIRNLIFSPLPIKIYSKCNIVWQNLLHRIVA